MFTGIVQQRAFLVSRSLSGKSGKLTVQLECPLQNPQVGESIAVNGTCLTLEKAEGKLCVFHVLAETLKKTNLGDRPVGALLNVERALRMGDAIGGHLVSGHVDGTGQLIECKKVKGDYCFRISIPESVAEYTVPKGSIAIDGVSLTIVQCDETELSVSLIPTTLSHTNLKSYKTGEKINLEADLIAKQVAFQVKRMFTQENCKTQVRPLTMDDIFNAGF